MFDIDNEGKCIFELYNMTIELRNYGVHNTPSKY